MKAEELKTKKNASGKMLCNRIQNQIYIPETPRISNGVFNERGCLCSPRCGEPERDLCDTVKRVPHPAAGCSIFNDILKRRSTYG
jgi:hypothetical protein